MRHVYDAFTKALRGGDTKRCASANPLLDETDIGRWRTESTAIELCRGKVRGDVRARKADQHSGKVDEQGLVGLARLFDRGTGTVRPGADRGMFGRWRSRAQFKHLGEAITRANGAFTAFRLGDLHEDEGEMNRP